MSNTRFFFKMLITVLIASFTLSGSIGCGGGNSRAVMIGHRGYSGKYLDNTALAFRKAAEHGFGGAETDIRRTKDGVYVTNHNKEVVFADGTELIIEENTFEELSKKPLKNKKTRDKVYLCTLSEYLEIMRDNDMVCFVELKDEFTDEQVKEIFELVEDIYSLDKCILQSFNFDNLIRARELFPELPVMLTYGSGDTGYERCFEYGFSIDANLNSISKEMVDAFHERGLLVAGYTANDRLSLAYAKTFDLDFIESDYFA